MDEDRLDLSALDPTVDEVRWMALLQRIRAEAAPELARRAGRASVLGMLGNWAWPVLAAASLIALLSGGALALIRPPELWSGVVQALQLDGPVSEWLDENRSPTTTDLLFAIEGGS